MASKAGNLDGLRKCRDTIGRQWRFGVLLHGGTETVGLDERTIAVPFGVFFGLE